MNVSEKKALVKEYFDHAAALKEKRDYNKKHQELRARDLHKQLKVLAERKENMIIHEEENALKKGARTKEIEKHQAFLKLSSALNII